MEGRLGESGSEPESAQHGRPQQNACGDLADNFWLAEFYERLPEQLCQADQQKQDKEK